MMKRECIPIDECRETMVLAKDMYNEAGLLLLTRGTRLTPDKVRVLHRRGITMVPVEKEN